MPSDTFYNLPDEKRDRLIRTAVREFAAHGYRGSSVQVVAERAGVAKGSIYQYFKNKKELFLYIFELAVEEKIKYVNGVIIENSTLPFFQLLEKLFLDAAREAVKKPELYQLYNELLSGATVEIREEIQVRISRSGRDYYRKLLKHARKSGQIRKDISLDLAVFVVYTFLRDFGELLGARLEKLPWKDLRVEVEQMIDILKNGIAVEEGTT